MNAHHTLYAPNSSAPWECSPVFLYPTHEYAPRLFANFDPAQDQLLGAVIMKLGGMFVSFLTLIWVFYRWYQSTERSAKA